MTKRVSKLVAGTALVVAAFAACGSSSEDKTVGPNPDGRLTKAEYIKQGDSICAQQLEKTDPKNLPEPKADPPAEWVRYLEARQAVDTPFDEQFKALKAPLADQGIADELNRDLDATTTKFQEALTAARSGNTRGVHDLLGQANATNDSFARRAKEYGFKECSKVE